MILGLITFLFALDCSNIRINGRKFDISTLKTPFMKTIDGGKISYEFQFSPCQKLQNCSGYSCLKYKLSGAPESSAVDEKLNDADPDISYESNPERLVLRYSQVIGKESHLTTVKIGHSDKDQSSNYANLVSDYNVDIKKTILAEFVNDKIAVSDAQENPPSDPIKEGEGIGWFSWILISVGFYFLFAAVFRAVILKEKGLNIIPHLSLFRRLSYMLEDSYQWIRSRSHSGGQYMQL